MKSFKELSTKGQILRILLWIGAGIGVLLALATFILSRPSKGLSALRHDPMSRYVPPGAKQSHRAESDKGLIPFAGSTGYPYLSRRFANCNDACYDQLAIEARRVGWKNPFVSPEGASFETASFQRPADDPNSHLILRLFRKDSEVPTEVSLSLSYEGGAFKTRPNS
jgi:hypothetical protein